jgi:hypothetical protein
VPARPNDPGNFAPCILRVSASEAARKRFSVSLKWPNIKARTWPGGPLRAGAAAETTFQRVQHSSPGPAAASIAQCRGGGGACFNTHGAARASGHPGPVIPPYRRSQAEIRIRVRRSESEAVLRSCVESGGSCVGPFIGPTFVASARSSPMDRHRQALRLLTDG